jgi:hypothetical protein
MSDKKDLREDLRTKVSIGSTSIFGSTTTHVMAYKPSVDEHGNLDVDNNGNIVKLIKLGGVKVGAMGRIAGRPVKVVKTQLVEYAKSPGSFALDVTELVPVELTEYKQLAWFPTEHTKVVG